MNDNVPQRDDGRDWRHNILVRAPECNQKLFADRLISAQRSVRARVSLQVYRRDLQAVSISAQSIHTT
jgi:hypothetical protein